MKKLLKGDVLLVILATLLWCGSSCTTTQKTVIGKSLAAIQTSVDGAMKAYAELVAQGKVSQAVIDKVKDLHDNKYQPAMRAAIRAARYDYDRPAGETIETIAGELLAVIVEVTK